MTAPTPRSAETMRSFLIQGASALHTGDAEGAIRTPAQGTDVRVRDGLIAEVGALAPEPGEAGVDARDAVLYPGWVNTHHHLFQTVLKNVSAGQGVPLMPWLEAVPYHHGPLIDEEALTVAATLGLAELLLSGCTTVADHHYLFGAGVGHDPAAVLFGAAESLGARFVLLRGGATRTRSFATREHPPPPLSPRAPPTSCATSPAPPADGAWACTRTCPRPPTTCASPPNNGACAPCTGARSTNGSAPMCRTPTWFTSMTAKSRCAAKRAPPSPTARKATAAWAAVWRPCRPCTTPAPW